ncbi:MAG: DUF547 domain-containing protein [Candidatus Thiodiazotropha sp. (ex Ctena orbiculata)]|uniref:DUF547 domain-containing protein n=1 Tax=Candidatus Thiodiazotropha taylori TaxID=2792791 RepID=A0A944M987_9GAMM|nr:DUF547 domain-containing protein [Candidatus Thiodiazotropha taylori]MBT2989425.1 DUF547 domain-containing protein [Candidatus Thiodiazotropha taylori]MBT2997005.1 DUF547 domain-containing protein [Candidatus Thiodiazotropha taylori]MBT3000860.1 DUF547 domain-containing protein [Candidatus Thiodiazotropha taylori]MBV2108205.1 DUF547 domain-containing protein [Candidatus Thiodiazotropha taylori]
MSRVLPVVVFSLIFISVTDASAFDHTVWNSLLQQHVVPQRDGVTTAVDYRGLNEDRVRLKQYLASLAAVDKVSFETWPAAEKLAFLINAYNAWTVELILTAYPRLTSIKELGSFFSSPWKKDFVQLFGEKISLDDIEHGMIRKQGEYDEPRIHFAVNCASIGCPALRAEAYTGERLEMQLTEQTELFLADRTRNRFTDNRLEISSIFKWYRDDFERGWRGYRSLADFIAQYGQQIGLSVEDVQRLRRDEIDISFLDYDWRLNSLARERSR